MSVSSRTRTKTAKSTSATKTTASKTPVGIAVDFAFDKKPFYSPAEIARVLDVSDQTVLDWIHGDRLFAAQIGPRLYRVPLASLMQFLGVPPQIRWTRGSKARRINDAELDRAER